MTWVTDDRLILSSLLNHLSQENVTRQRLHLPSSAPIVSHIRAVTLVNSTANKRILPAYAIILYYIM